MSYAPVAPPPSSPRSPRSRSSSRSQAAPRTSSDAGSGDGESTEHEVVKIGVVGKGDAQWAPFVDAAADEGIKVELVDFGSYEQPNPALTEGEIDLNQFQHIVYLARVQQRLGL